MRRTRTRAEAHQQVPLNAPPHAVGHEPVPSSTGADSDAPERSEPVPEANGPVPEAKEESH